MQKILVVDSSVQTTLLIKQCLLSTGYEILTAGSGSSAFAQIGVYRPDLIILAMELADMSGYDFCKRLKSNPDTEMTMVLMLTSFESRDFLIRAVEVGADDLIEKNFNTYSLISKINSLLRVKHLSDQLVQKFKELEEKNQLIEVQLKMARQVQNSLLHDFDINVDGTRIFSKYLPAADIGGDFYDVIQMDSSRYAVIMGDVSGHGISAALLTALLTHMVNNLATQYFNPDQLLFYLNKEFNRFFSNNVSQIYACIFYAVIDTDRQKIYYSNAGQALPIFVDAAAGEAFELESSGVPIGMMPDSSYSYETISYNSGDMVLFQTDGLADVFYKNSPDEYYRNMKQLLIELISSEPSEIFDVLLSSFYKTDVSASEKKQLDDVSLIICKL